MKENQGGREVKEETMEGKKPDCGTRGSRTGKIKTLREGEVRAWFVVEVAE